MRKSCPNVMHLFLENVETSQRAGNGYIQVINLIKLYMVCMMIAHA